MAAAAAAEPVPEPEAAEPVPEAAEPVPEATEPVPAAEPVRERVVAQWKRYAKEILRLGFKRKQWSHLGRWLNAARKGVRQIPDQDVGDWWKAL